MMIAQAVTEGRYADAQDALNRAGFGPLVVDGVWGPRSRAAYEAWRASRPQGAATRDPHTLALAAMGSWADMGVRESGHNRGRWPTAIATYGGRDPSSDGAWCAWGVSAALLIAAHASGTELVTRTSGAVRSLWQLNPGAQTRGPRPGDVFIRARKADDVPAFTSGSPLGHCGLVERVYADGVMHTIECNTDGDGGAEGDGVYRRTLRTDDPRLVGYISPLWRLR